MAWGTCKGEPGRDGWMVEARHWGMPNGIWPGKLIDMTSRLFMLRPKTTYSFYSPISSLCEKPPGTTVYAAAWILCGCVEYARGMGMRRLRWLRQKVVVEGWSFRWRWLCFWCCGWMCNNSVEWKCKFYSGVPSSTVGVGLRGRRCCCCHCVSFRD